MKLIHCADIHLDSPLALFPSDKAKQRRAEILDTFCRIVRFADENDVAAILIAGDLFDSPKQIRKRTRDRVRELIAEHPGLQFCYLPGNHDGGAALYDDATPPPENFHAFGPRWTTYRLGDVTVTAAGRPNADALQLDPADVNIVMLHGTAVESMTGSGKEDLPIHAYAGKQIDYLALGHIHSQWHGNVDNRCRAYYSGCPEGRGFDECGEKGFLLLEITPDRRVEPKFVPFASRTLHDVRVDLSGCTSQADLERRVDEATADIPDRDLVKLTTVGELDPLFTPEYCLIERDLGNRFWFFRRKDETKPLIRPEDYQNDISLKGEFIRRVMTSDLPPEDRNRVILNGLRALYGEEPDL